MEELKEVIENEVVEPTVEADGLNEAYHTDETQLDNGYEVSE